MARVKVLIVDDAVVIRKILTDALAADPEIEVIGTAANGKIALQKLTQCTPDIITMDVEMPEMNGIETVRAIRATHPKLPIIMFSTLTERGASTTFEALGAGATDYVAKPANVGKVTTAKERVQQELIAKIKALVQPRATAPKAPGASVTASPRVVATARPPVSSGPLGIICIGVSTGGPNALAEIFTGWKRRFPIPIVIVQHMPPLFTRMLAERLSSRGAMSVFEATDGMRIEAGNGYIAPGNFHMVLNRLVDGSLVARLNQDPPENSCRPAVDPLFRSVASLFGPKALAAVLTGMGYDGLRGGESIVEQGGQLLAQDQATSVVWGMPGAVADAGIAHMILPLKELGEELERCAFAHEGMKANLQRAVS